MSGLAFLDNRLSCWSPQFESLRNDNPIEHHLLAGVSVIALVGSLCPHGPRPDIFPVLQIAALLEPCPLVRCSSDVQAPAFCGELRGDAEPHTAYRSSNTHARRRVGFPRPSSPLAH